MFIEFNVADRTGNGIEITQSHFFLDRELLRISLKRSGHTKLHDNFQESKTNF